MEPINYMLDVANPMQMALGGYETALGQAQTRQQMGIANAQEARAAEAFALEKRAMEEQRAAAAAERQAAIEARQRGDAAMMRLIELGPNATSKDYLIAINENPAYKESLSMVFDTFSEERKAGEIQSGLQLWAAVKSNPEVAASLIAERKRAAEAAGDQETFDTMRAFELQLAGPGGSDLLAATLGSSLAGIMGADDFKKAAEAIGVGSGEPTGTFKTLQERAAAAGLTPGTPEYQQFMLRGGEADKGPLVQNIVGAGETEFAKKAGAEAATQFSTVANQGTAASRALVELENLEANLSGVDTGGGAAFKAFLGGYGIATEGLGEIQAAQAAINRLVPQQHPPGSGTMSDADLALFKASLPALINQPGGNQIIIETIRAINEYDVAASIIAGQALDGEITQAEARKRLRELPNPLADFKAPKAAAKPAPAPVVIDGVTIQRIE